MKPIDVLKELASGNMTEDDVYAFEEKVLACDEIAVPAHTLLMLSEYEWTAICHSAGFGTLAKWRYQGWPTHCAICGKEIKIENYGWWAGRTDVQGDNVLMHTSCIPINPDYEEEC